MYKKLQKSGKYSCLRGEYKPINKEKYIGDPNPKFRSKLEYRLMIFCDHSPLVINWSYEKIIIPYIDKTRNNTKHNYYMDFKIKMKSKNGTKTLLVEVKSEKETKKPKESQRKKRSTYVKEMETWIRNQCKWDSAERSCKKRGWQFKILTENQLK